MNNKLGPLVDGGRVVIIGGGPGGTGCALALHRLAAQRGRDIHITILEGKQFQGQHHYNQCAGVLSPPLPTMMQELLGLPFPSHLTKRQISGYTLHAGGRVLQLNGHAQSSVALRRVEFDAYMLAQAQQRGITVMQVRATDLEFHSDRVVVYTENPPIEADVVVGAFGLDEGSAALFTRQTGYRPPQALYSVVTKFHPGESEMAQFGGDIHAMLPKNPRIEFAAITPKGNHLTINIAGDSVDATLMDAFLHTSEVLQLVPALHDFPKKNTADLQFYKGRFPCSLAKNYFGDRYVMVGDAAGLVRAFKGKGVTSAVLTGQRAAETMLQQGISRSAFREHYIFANQDIIRDLPYGRMMRHLAILMARVGALRPVMLAAERDPAMQDALFGAVSAHQPYRQVFWRLIRPAAALHILRALFG